MRILLVDDSKTMRTIQRSVLGQIGHWNIEEAAGNDEALAKARATRPDLVLVDRTMPDSDGPTVVKALRQNGCRATVLLMVTESEKPDVTEALRCGADGHIVKPFTPEQIDQRISETLAHRAAA